MDVSIQNKKQQLFGEWVNEHSDSLYTWAYHKTSSKETAEDLVQETFLTAFSSYEKFQNKSHPKTWLFSILNNKIIDHYRKISKSYDSLDALPENKANQITESMFDNKGSWSNSENNTVWDNEKHLLDDEEFNAVLQFCLGDLPEKWNTVITSKYLLEKNPNEICQELELSTTNYWQVIHRAKLLLKKCIEKYWKK